MPFVLMEFQGGVRFVKEGPGGGRPLHPPLNEALIARYFLEGLRIILRPGEGGGGVLFLT